MCNKKHNSTVLVLGPDFFRVRRRRNLSVIVESLKTAREPDGDNLQHLKKSAIGSRKSRDRCNRDRRSRPKIRRGSEGAVFASPVLSHVEGPATDTQGFCAHFSCGKHRHPNCRLYSANRIRHLGARSLCLGYTNSGQRHLTLNLFRNPHHVYSSLRNALSESE